MAPCPETGLVFKTEQTLGSTFLVRSLWPAYFQWLVVVKKKCATLFFSEQCMFQHVSCGLIRVFQQFAFKDFQVLRNLFNNADRGVSSASFEVANIGSVNINVERKLLLRQTLLLSQASQVVSKAFPNIHATRMARMLLNGLQTISDMTVDGEH